MKASIMMDPHSRTWRADHEEAIKRLKKKPDGEEQEFTEEFAYKIKAAVFKHCSRRTMEIYLASRRQYRERLEKKKTLLMKKKTKKELIRERRHVRWLQSLDAFDENKK